MSLMLMIVVEGVLQVGSDPPRHVQSFGFHIDFCKPPDSVVYTQYLSTVC